MPVYIIADVTVTDEAKMRVYREWSSRAMQEHGARILVRGGTVEPLEGEWVPQRVVMLEFPTLGQARAFYDSETYRHARGLREGAGSMRMIAVQGVEPAPSGSAT
jgi:uncharacterized protein (DUF1330 family)